MSTSASIRLPRVRLVNVQVLRAVAALLVVVAHSVDLNEEIGGTPDAPGVVGHLENIGAFGVDLFFIISGFVMALSVAGRTGPRAAGDFLARRWIRIAPPYLVASVIVILVMGYYRRVLPTEGGIGTMLLFVPVSDPSGWSPPPLDIGWTLSFEFTFYLLMALTVVLKQRAETLALGLVALVVAGRVLPHSSFLAGWFTNPILLEFALGIGIYAGWSRGWFQRVKPLWLAGGVLGVLALVGEVLRGFGQIDEQQFTTGGSLSMLRVALWGVPAALIFLAVITLREPREGLVLRTGKRLGDASYSIYLAHRPALVVIGAQIGFSPFPVPPLVTIALAVLIAVGAGLLYFRTVERPLTRRLTALYAKRAPRRAAAPVGETA